MLRIHSLLPLYPSLSGSGRAAVVTPVDRARARRAVIQAMASLWQFNTNLIPKEAERRARQQPSGGANTEEKDREC